jgi:hypothetical protein
MDILAMRATADNDIAVSLEQVIGFGGNLSTLGGVLEVLRLWSVNPKPVGSLLAVVDFGNDMGPMPNIVRNVIICKQRSESGQTLRVSQVGVDWWLVAEGGLHICLQ